MAKQSSLRKYVSNNYLVLFIIFALLLVAAAGLVLSFILWDDLLYLKFIFGGVILVLVVLILVFYIYFSERTYKLFYETLYKNTQKNLEAIKDSQVDTAEIKDSSMEEFQEVNELFSDISNQVKNRVVVTTNANYESLHLDYEDEELGIVKYESLVMSLTNLIILTKSYRNALCELFYEIEDEGLEEKDYKKILNEIKKVIKYDNLLISKNKHRNGFVLYIPVFDNVNQLEERDFVYADPPYLITCATYNEQGGWNEDLEHALYGYLDDLHAHHIRFALSNVLSSKGRTNTILQEWLANNNQYTCIHLDYNYSNSSYHTTDRTTGSDEVLIINY